MVSLAVNVCPPESQSDRSNVKVSPAWSPSVTDTVSSVSDTVDACQDGYMFASHASTSLFCLVVSKTTCFFVPKYNKNLDFKGNPQ